MQPPVFGGVGYAPRRGKEIGPCSLAELLGSGKEFLLAFFLLVLGPGEQHAGSEQEQGPALLDHNIALPFVPQAESVKGLCVRSADGTAQKKGTIIQSWDECLELLLQVYVEQGVPRLLREVAMGCGVALRP